VAEQNLGGGDDEERTPLRLKETLRDLTYISVLGQGGYGTVLLAQCNSVDYKEDFCAVKVLTKRDIIERKREERVMRERDILKLVYGHPFVINLYCCFQDEVIFQISKSVS
jgi:serine/threonine protein kinase